VILCNQFPAHVGRILLRGDLQIIQLPLFPDEMHIHNKHLTPTIRMYL
jgi:hypothetical protein